MEEKLKKSLSGLLRYIEKEDFRGYDPFDALNSPVINLVSGKSKLLRIGAIQVLRRLPFNIRPIIGIKKDYNPKAMGLFLSSYSSLYNLYKDESYSSKIKILADWLIDNASNGYSGHCWGYNFNWQNKSFYIPKGVPTIVNTAFIGHAFLDAFEAVRTDKYMEIAISSCNFILEDLNIYEAPKGLCFSYTPIDKSRVHNANYLGASLLIRAYSLTHDKKFLEYGQKAYEYSTDFQMNDGSWFYGEADYQKWIDSFHTGFNLDALYLYEKCLNDQKYKPQLDKGLDFYINNFFMENGTPKYYCNSVYPIDIHCPAQALVTLSKSGQYNEKSIPTLIKVLEWTIENMLDSKGFFYFRKSRIFTNKIAYIRWSQAWMLRGLTNALSCF